MPFYNREVEGMPVIKRDLSGYTIVKMPDHPRAIRSGGSRGFVFEHILEAEKMLGRPIGRHEHVHHKDGNRKNNSHDNLIVFATNGDHVAFHRNGLDESRLEMNGDGSYSCRRAVATCSKCGEEIGLHTKNGVCQRCLAESRRVVERPSQEELVSDIMSMPMTSVGRKYGVSDNAIRKWLRGYGLSRDEISGLARAGRESRKARK